MCLLEQALLRASGSIKFDNSCMVCEALHCVNYFVGYVLVELLVCLLSLYSPSQSCVLLFSVECVWDVRSSERVL